MSSDKSWQQLAQEKRDAIAAAIPKEWILSKVPRPEEQRDVSGTYIGQFLSPQEKEITEVDAVCIVAKATTGEWKAVDVVRAFCHRAAIAHQLVRHIFLASTILGQCLKTDSNWRIGPLLTRNLLRRRHQRRRSPRCLLRRAQEAHRSSTRSAGKLKGPIPRQRS